MFGSGFFVFFEHRKVTEIRKIYGSETHSLKLLIEVSAVLLWPFQIQKKC